MAGSNAIRAGRAFVELFADDTELAKGLRSAEGKLRRFGASVAKIGTAIAGTGALVTGPLVAAAHTFASVGDNIQQMAQRTGIGATAMSELGYAAEQAGASAEQVAGAMFRMQRRVERAARSTGPAVQAISRLGLSAEALAQMDPDRQFMALADALKDVEDEGKRAQIAFEIFGDSAKSLMPLLTAGSVGIGQLRQEAHDVGVAFSEEAAKQAEAFSTTLGVLRKALQANVLAVGEAVVPALTDLANKIIGVLRQLRTWIENNRQLFVTLLRIGGGMLVLGTTVAALGTGFIALAQAVGLARTAMTGATLAAKGLGIAMAALKAHPIIFALAGVTAGLMALAWWANRSRDAMQQLARAMESVREEGDRQRAQDLLRVRRLEQLADRAKLNNDQMNEAQRIIEHLERRYGDFGVTLGETTHRVEGMEDALHRLNSAMRLQALGEIEEELKAVGAETHELFQEMLRLEGQLASQQDWLFGHTLEGTRDGLAEVEAKMADAAKRLQALTDRRQALLDGDDTALTAVDEETDLRARTDAGELLTEHERQWARRVNQLKLEQVRDEHKRAVALINERYDHEVAEAKRADHTIERIEEARQVELENAELRRQQAIAAHREQWQQRAHEAQLALIEDEQERELAQVNARFDREVEEARKASMAIEDIERAREARLAEVRRRYRKQEQDEQDRINQSNENLQRQIAELRLRTTLKGRELEEALLDLREKHELEDARQRGLDLDLVRERFELERKMLGLREATMSRMGGVTGSYNAREVQAAMGRGSNEQQRLAKAAEDTARTSGEIARNTRDLLDEFRDGQPVVA